MKALLIADNELAIENISTVVKAAGYDIIVYRWLLKALDNIEEIAPHLIIVSANDYPRHWKTLVQFVKSGICEQIPQIILYTDSNFSQEEKNKANTLGVRGFFDSVDVAGLDDLRKILRYQNDIYSGNLGVQPDDIFNTTKHTSPVLIFTHPLSGYLITGSVIKMNGDEIIFKPDRNEFLTELHTPLLIPDVTLKNGSTVYHVTAKIEKKSGTEIYIQVQSV
jgi:hypothetical protein